MVDAADQEKIEASKNELHNLLDKPQLQGIPVSPAWSGRARPGTWGWRAGPVLRGGAVWGRPGHGSPRPSPVLSPPQVLVLGNKRDLPGALDEKELIEKM